MTAKPPLFQEFVRSELGLIWVFSIAMGIGLLAGALGKFMQLPQEVYAFNRALEKAQLYEFFYDQYLKDPKYRKPELITREEQVKVDELTKIVHGSSPGYLVAMLMFVVGLGISIAFVLKLTSALHKRIHALEKAVHKEGSGPSPEGSDSASSSEEKAT